MKRLIPSLILFLACLAPLTGRADSGVAFHGIGDLAGGPTLSIVRDATRVGGVIYAVGGSASVNQVLCVSPNNPVGCVPSFGTDTSTLWTWDGSSGHLTALPNLVVNTTANIPIQANAITPDAAFIASQARSVAVGGNRLAVRVDRSLLPAASANLNLNVAPFVTYTQPTSPAAISANGAVLVMVVNPSVRTARVDVNNPAGNVLVPLLRPTDTNNQPSLHGLSSSGNVIAGTSFSVPYSGTVGGQAFRYMFNPATNTGSLAGIPFLPGGTWNKPAAISPSGQFTLVEGNSTEYPNGEVAVHDAATNTFTTLGSPNTPWTPALGGMTADHAVVVVTFGASNGYRQGYFHNANGWFHLESALGASGVDVITGGWRQLVVSGISGDGTLVYGQGLHNGNTEGFVAEFPAGYLATFDVPAVPAADTAIVGTWLVPSDTVGDPQPGGVLAFMTDGTYFFVQQHATAGSPAEAAGFERGRYTWNAATGAFRIDTVQDTTGDSGASDANGQLNITATISGDTLTITDPDDPDGGPGAMTRLLPVPGTLVGGWIGGDPAQANSSLLFVGMPDGSYYMANDVEAMGGDHDGIEWGTFSYDASTGIISGTPSVDTNGTLGFSNPSGPVTVHIAADDLTASGTDDMGDPIFMRRIVDPNTVRPAFINAGSVDATLGAPFSFATVTTFGAYTFTADGLPAGLSIDGSTGVISGTPAALGAFAVTLTASNSLATGTGSLVITIDPIVCPAGSHLAAPTDLTCTPDPPVITRSGFYSPVKSGVNDQKGGSTVPLKFNVTVNGAQKTDTAGLAFSLTRVNCATSAPIAPATFAMTGGTGLRYEDGQFIANWKTPTDAGSCYVVTMTTTADGGSISATFKIK